MLPTKFGRNQFSVLEKKSFKGKVYAGRWTGGDHYSSLEPSVQVS